MYLMIYIIGYVVCFFVTFGITFHDITGYPTEEENFWEAVKDYGGSLSEYCGGTSTLALVIFGNIIWPIYFAVFLLFVLILFLTKLGIKFVFAIGKWLKENKRKSEITKESAVEEVMEK